MNLNLITLIAAFLGVVFSLVAIFLSFRRKLIYIISLIWCLALVNYFTNITYHTNVPELIELKHILVLGTILITGHALVDIFGYVLVLLRIRFDAEELRFYRQNTRD